MKSKNLNRKGTNMFHMEQKDYKLEILIILGKASDHVRSIAKKLNINHMMIARKLKVLLDKNVVDFVQDGRNRNYFLKKNAEARSYILMAENYKLSKILEKYSILREVVEKIQKDKRIKLAMLFGSYAKGLAKKDSDFDVFIETNKLKIKKEYSKFDSKLSIKIGKLGNDNLSKEIQKNFVLIKGGEKYYESFFE